MKMPLTGAQMLQIVTFLKTHHLMILLEFDSTELWFRFCKTRAVYYGVGRFVAVKPCAAMRMFRAAAAAAAAAASDNDQNGHRHHGTLKRISLVIMCKTMLHQELPPWSPSSWTTCASLQLPSYALQGRSIYPFPHIARAASCRKSPAMFAIIQHHFSPIFR